MCESKKTIKIRKQVYQSVRKCSINLLLNSLACAAGENFGFSSISIGREYLFYKSLGHPYA